MTANRITKNVKIDTAVVGCLPLLDPAKDSHQLRTYIILFRNMGDFEQFYLFQSSFCFAWNLQTRLPPQFYDKIVSVLTYFHAVLPSLSLFASILYVLMHFQVRPI